MVVAILAHSLDAWVTQHLRVRRVAPCPSPLGSCLRRNDEYTGGIGDYEGMISIDIMLGSGGRLNRTKGLHVTRGSSGAVAGNATSSIGAPRGNR